MAPFLRVFVSWRAFRDERYDLPARIPRRRATIRSWTVDESLHHWRLYRTCREVGLVGSIRNEAFGHPLGLQEEFPISVMLGDVSVARP